MPHWPTGSACTPSSRSWKTCTSNTSSRKPTRILPANFAKPKLARDRFIGRFIEPIEKDLRETGFQVRDQGPAQVHLFHLEQNEEIRKNPSRRFMICLPSGLFWMCRRSTKEKAALLAGLLHRDGPLQAQPRPPERLDQHPPRQRLRVAAHDRYEHDRAVGGGTDPNRAHERDCRERLRGPLEIQRK